MPDLPEGTRSSLNNVVKPPSPELLEEIGRIASDYELDPNPATLAALLDAYKMGSDRGFIKGYESYGSVANT